MIWAAAVQYVQEDGTTITIPCFRHGYGMQLCRLLNKDIADHCKLKEGFLTTNQEFLNRKEAFNHVLNCGQLSQTTQWYKKDHNDTELYTEDLW